MFKLITLFSFHPNPTQPPSRFSQTHRRRERNCVAQLQPQKPRPRIKLHHTNQISKRSFHIRCGVRNYAGAGGSPLMPFVAPSHQISFSFNPLSAGWPEQQNPLMKSENYFIKNLSAFRRREPHQQQTNNNKQPAPSSQQPAARIQQPPHYLHIGENIKKCKPEMCPWNEWKNANENFPLHTL